MKGAWILPSLTCNLLPLAILISSFTTSAKLIVVANATHLNSSHPEINYPNNNETLDVIWVFKHSIRLHINEFHLNGHSGDFVLISDLPLLNSEDFEGDFNNTSEGIYLEELSKSIITDQGLLLSWLVAKTIEVISDRGTFVLFHAEAKVLTGTSKFKGFDIEVEKYDNIITTTTTATPDPYVPPKDEEHYITKFLNCKEPLKFYRELDDFKEKIALIATEYCNESNVPACLASGDIRMDEVNIPGANEGKYAGLHYCDETWGSFNRCVEVTFAIIRADKEGHFVLPRDQLEKMWAMKSEKLVKFGYCPYDPPESNLDLNTVVWIAYFLGIILGLTVILLGCAWFKNTRTLFDYRKSFMDHAGQDEKIKAVSDVKPQQKHYDERNPIYNIIPKSNFRDDHLYPSNYLHVDDVDDATSPGPVKKRSTDNPAYFQNVEADVYAYDNTGYEKEENPTTPFSARTRNNGEQIVMRSRSSKTSLSDTEI